ncbi:hypothetical protein RF11_11862 [Thelohanellus kitauei]|uniref:Uncharacterized protein n=1 Tax=Thelohanellus kitauei TaxID=669202 RepID=A0A0C2MII4_THEKT|nr:hypothetical protein RF11_11862 [Thelohanellus kitauei]
MLIWQCSHSGQRIGGMFIGRGPRATLTTCRSPEVFKPALVHYSTDFTSTATATVLTYDNEICPICTLHYAVKLARSSHLLNIHPYPVPPELRCQIGIHSLVNFNVCSAHNKKNENEYYDIS